MGKRSYYWKILIGALILGNCLFPTVTCRAEETEVLPVTSKSTIWQNEDAKAKVEIFQENNLQIQIDAKQMEESYEQIIVDLIGEELFGLGENDVLWIDYSYTGEKPIYLQVDFNDIFGTSANTDALSFYWEQKDEKNYICEMEEQLICIYPGEQARLGIPIGKMEKDNVDLEQLYGITFELLVEKQETCELEIVSVQDMTGEEAVVLSNYQKAFLQGNENVTIPSVGSYFYEYSSNVEGITFEGIDSVKGCSIDENGRMELTEEAEEGYLALEACTQDGIYLKKEVRLTKEVGNGYQILDQDEVKKISFSFEFLNSISAKKVCRIILVALLAGCLLCYTLIQMKISQKTRMAEEEERY
ncbi:MAG: hypothetical protein ACI4ES_13485 [Roseburia sp.]